MCKKLLFVFCVLIFVVGFAVTAQANLLQNAGFEDNTGGGGSADWWANSGDAKTENWGDFSERGTGSWGIAIMDWVGDKDGEVYQDVSSIASSTQYQFDIWAKRDAGDVTGVYYMTLEWYVDSVYISEGSQNITLTDIWVEQSFTATSPGTANEVRVLFGQDTTQCGKWDDASFAEVPESATIALFGFGGLILLRKRKASSVRQSVQANCFVAHGLC